MATFHFELVSPDKISFSGEVDQVDVPGSEGDFGVLAGHVPLIALIRPGLMTVYAGGEQTKLVMLGGFAEVGSDVLTPISRHQSATSTVTCWPAKLRISQRTSQMRRKAICGTAPPKGSNNSWSSKLLSAMGKSHDHIQRYRNGFEAKFAIDKNLEFQARARGNRLGGQWAAQKLGLAGPEAEAYAKELVVVDLESPATDAVFRKVRGDLEAKGIAQSDHQIRKTRHITGYRRLPSPIHKCGWKVFCTRCHRPRQGRGNSQYRCDSGGDCDPGRFARNMIRPVRPIGPVIED